MCKLLKIWAHRTLLSSQTEMRQMHKPMPPKRKLERWKSSWELQGMSGLQGPTKKNTQPFPKCTVYHTNHPAGTARYGTAIIIKTKIPSNIN
jgi:hypothetical protein